MKKHKDSGYNSLVIIVKRNMRNTTCLLTILLLVSLTSCLDRGRTYWSEDNYEVQDNPGEPCKTLYYELEDGAGIGRVDYVTKIGSNDRFLIIESIITSKNEKAQYWIIDKMKDKPTFNGGEIREGPLSLDSFKDRKKQLGIEGLTFEKEFD